MRNEILNEVAALANSVAMTAFTVNHEVDEKAINSKTLYALANELEESLAKALSLASQMEMEENV